MTEGHPKGNRLIAAEALVSGEKTLEELIAFRELMLEHAHRFEADPKYAGGPVVVGFRLLIEVAEARIRLKDFLLAEHE